METPVVRCGLLSTLLLSLVLAVLPSNSAIVSAYPSPCSQYIPAVSQNCYLYLSTPVPWSTASSTNPYTSRYDCALALGYYLPCLVNTANSSYSSTYAALSSTSCLLGRGTPSLVNHTTLTVLEVDSAQRVGLLSAYRHDNSTLSGNVGSCVGLCREQGLRCRVVHRSAVLQCGPGAERHRPGRAGHHSDKHTEVELLPHSHQYRRPS